MHAPSGLLTDLYELTMAAGYVANRLDLRATFELFARDLPPRRGYLVAAGLEQALDYLEGVRFAPAEIEHLRKQPLFARVGPEFWDYLSRFRFAGDVWAMPEGTPAFPGEPLLRVTAPIADAQIVETCLLAGIGFQTLIASKAARVCAAARGKDVVEFGSRRAHGIEAGVLAARAAFIGGCQGTSNVYAGLRFDIPVFGTQAHSWIMAHEDEEEAFRSFLRLYPEHAVLLLDTYDVRAAVEKIVAAGRNPSAVRLDSGDLAADSAWVRERLDAAGWREVRILASGDLDEDRIHELLARGACIDAFGVGTALSTSSDAPALGVVYKLVEVEQGRRARGAIKLSHAKATYPGRKQVFRFADAAGRYTHDVIGLEGESHAGGEPLLVAAMTDGKRTHEPRPPREARERCRLALARLPESCRALDPSARYPVRRSPRLEELLRQARGQLRRAGVSGTS